MQSHVTDRHYWVKPIGLVASIFTVSTANMMACLSWFNDLKTLELLLLVFWSCTIRCYFYMAGLYCHGPVYLVGAVAHERSLEGPHLPLGSDCATCSLWRHDAIAARKPLLRSILFSRASAVCRPLRTFLHACDSSLQVQPSRSGHGWRAQDVVYHDMDSALGPEFYSMEELLKNFKDVQDSLERVIDLLLDLISDHRLKRWSNGVIWFF